MLLLIRQRKLNLKGIAMSNNYTRTHKHSNIDPQGEEWPEKMTLSLARKFLGISFSKMSTLVSTGIIKVERNPLDNRVNLVLRTDLEELKRQYSYMQQNKEIGTPK
jgi:hypothetical protein